MSQPQASRGFWNSWAGVCAILLLGVLLFYLLTEHTAHLFGVLPYALLLVCPLLHILMHRSHAKNQGGIRDSSSHQH
jgi:hypothetical protein